jgi:anaerobic selenocysteine-containing dehydrogenase
LALRKGLLAGDWVRIFNDRGELRGTLTVKRGMHPHTIVTEQGWWNEMGASVNDLTPNTPADLGISIAVYDCLCDIEKTQPNTTDEQLHRGLP